MRNPAETTVPTLVDIFTFNESTALKLSGIFGRKPYEDDSEPDSPVCYSFRGVDLAKVPSEKLNRIVGRGSPEDVRECGGYEIRDSKTGRFIEITRSFVEELARTDYKAEDN